MKQIIQNLKSGETQLEEVPVPNNSNGNVLVNTSRSLVSLGTERMLVEFGKASLISKAKQQPDRVKQVLDKIKSDGLVPTLEAVFNKLDTPLPLGYCNVGSVIEVGSKVGDLNIGDRVASNGNHAEFVSVPNNLVGKIPENVTDEEACFTVIGSIGLQGIRLVNPTIGENIVVIGLGLIGLITAQILIANGCNVIGFDFDETKVTLAKSFGVKAFNAAQNIDQLKTVEELTKGVGADAVIITASNKSDTIISNAAKMSRKKGRIVLVGVIGLNINRADFYEKELSFQVSCSYGPGRYDENYEIKGNDYPIGFVRWTEKRNFETILNLISTKKIDVNPLITEIVELKDFGKIYNNIGSSTSIASILKYSDKVDTKRNVQLNDSKFNSSKGIISIVGTGNFTTMTVLPIMKKINAEIKYLCSSKGLTSTTLAKKYEIKNSTTDFDIILNDNSVNSVIITTRHNLHADMVKKSLVAGKHVFVEKPLVLNQNELEEIVSVYNAQISAKGIPLGKSQTSLMVGFNRRFSPFIKKSKELLGSANMPINIIATMNAGFIPKEVWVHDMEVGGGRIIGEACHFIDLIIYLSGSKVETVSMSALGNNPTENTDNAIITLKLENGSQGVINYFSNGSKAYSKERIEIYSQNRTIVIDNFREMFGYGFNRFKKLKLKQDKGHLEQFIKYISFLKNGGEPLIPFDEIINSSKASFAAIESLKTKQIISV